MKLKIRLFFQFVSLLICVYQACAALQKYFGYSKAIQTSVEKISQDEEIVVNVCSYVVTFNYVLANELGYSGYFLFLAGIARKSNVPTWKGIHQNLTYKKLHEMLYESPFNSVDVNRETDKNFVFHNGPCLKTISTYGKDIKISTKKRSLQIFLLHETSDKQITTNKSPESTITLDVEENNYDYLRYELTYEIHDDSINDGISCVDYRYLQENYGDCLYKELKQYVYSTYGCYPPWIEEPGNNVCEEDKIPQNMENSSYKRFLKDLDSLTDGDNIEMMKQCPSPCYTIKVIPILKTHFVNIRNFSYVLFTNNQETIRVFRSVYSYDLFALITELGSSLGLWLGLYVFLY